MGTRNRRGAIPLALAAASFALAVLQQPGSSSSDTKIDLHTRAAGLLGDVAHLWTSTAGLGGVESAQYSGYLFPMGPWFAGMEAVGVSDWLTDRLWLGLILTLGCWGVVRLADVLFERERGIGHLVAGAMYLLNPYVVVFSNRTSVTLLAYAALPWLVVIAWRGLRDPRRWRLAAAFALVLTASGPGVNVAVVAFVLLGPALLVAYELYLRTIERRAAWAFIWRAGVTSLAASVWWLVPAAAQGRYGIDFLKFTEPAGAIWSTTSLSESLRLMGYWVAYIGVGYEGVVRPYFSDAGVLLFEPVVVAATLIVPGLALGSFAWTRRARYAPFFLALVLLAALLMTVGFPDGTLLRRAATGAYNHLPSMRFLRTTYKAGPLLALGLALLAGLAAPLVAGRLRGAGRPLVAVAALALLAVSAWPLLRGQAVDSDVIWKRIPTAWTAAAAQVDRTLPVGKRALVMPGQLYSFYRWGGTVDPILPALTDRPVAVRTVTPYGDLHGTDLLWSTDGLVQQDRLVPGQLPALVKLLGAGALVVGTDDNYQRSAATDPASAARVLARQGYGKPDHVYGPRLRFPPAAGDLGASVALPQVRDYTINGARPDVRLEASRPAAVVDGSAPALADLAAFDALPSGLLDYAGDLRAGAIRSAARRGAQVVVSDSNRRRVVVISRMRQSTGPTLGANDAISEDAAVLNPFPRAGSAGQTVAVLRGARSIEAPFSPGYSQFPEHRPFAAFDGNPRTYWLADAALQPDRHWIEIRFDKPLDVPYIDVLPRGDAGAVPDELFVPGRHVRLERGWNHIPLNLRHADRLRLLVTARRSGSAAAGGLGEVRIPGVHVTQSLRPPTLAESVLRGIDLTHTSLTYLFERVTGDRPYSRGSSYGMQPRTRVHDPDRLEAARVSGAGDGELAIDRMFSAPARRAWSADGWAQVSPEAPDSALDRLLGGHGPEADSSGRFQGHAGYRASAAFDGSLNTAWISPFVDGVPAWISWSTAGSRTVRQIQLVPSRRRIRRPTIVRVSWPGGETQRLSVPSYGRIGLGRPVRARHFRVEVLAAAFPPGTNKRERARMAVGIAEIRGRGVPRIPRAPASGSMRSGCGSAFATAAGRRIPLRVTGTIRAFLAGEPLRAVRCGPQISLPAGSIRLKGGGDLFKLNLLRLRSSAPNPVTAPQLPGRVLDPGRAGRGGERDGIRIGLHAPATLVLGESYNEGWRAWCDGHSLGAPRIVDGYANGWDVKPGCRKVRFAFGPDNPVRTLQLLSGLACLVLLAIALWPPKRRGRDRVAARAEAFPDRLPETISPRASARRALLIGLAAAAVLGFCFSLRAGLAVFIGVALIVRLGIGPRVLALAAGALLAVVVPAVYLLFQATDRGGYNPGYASDHVGANWVAVAAYTMLLVSLLQTISRARYRPRDAAAAPAAAAASRSQP